MGDEESRSASDDLNVTVAKTYDADGNVATETAYNPTTGKQTTQYIYGTTLADSAIASSLLKRTEIYPDSTGGTDQVQFAYNRQRQVTSITDQNGTVREFDYDLLGRQTQDRVTTLGTGVDGSIRRIATQYEVRGMKTKLTSYDNATAGSGSIVNESQFAFDSFANLVTDYQSHSGAVNTASTPKVEYGFANGSANTIRPTTLTYPDGRVITYDYGSGGSIPDSLSRVDAVKDAATALAQYSYLGQSTFVITDYTQPDIEWILADLSGSNDPDTGDIYSGLDRFGRIKDNRWYNYGTSTDADRIKYGYDRNGNRTYRQNTVATASGAYFDELYANDRLDRLKSMDHGQLAALNTAITNKTFTQCWSLDTTGNWKKFLEDSNGDGTWDLNQSRTSNTVNEITGIATSVGTALTVPLYDKNGNMTRMPRPTSPAANLTATYDAWNRLVAFTAGPTSISNFSYDGAKRRIIQNSYSGGVLSETRHIYYTEPSRWQPIEERTGVSTTAERQFVWGLRYIDDLIERDRSGQRLYVMQDANWNTTALSNTSGTIQERYAYSAYGIPTFLTAAFAARASSLFAWETYYAGYRRELATGIYHVRHRAYNPLLGGWCQRDPLKYIDSHNVYSYCLSRPLIASDPSGAVIPLVVGAVIVGGIFFWPDSLGAPGPDDFVPSTNPGNLVCGGLTGATFVLGGGVFQALRNFGCFLPTLPEITVSTSAVCTALVACVCSQISGHDDRPCNCCRWSLLTYDVFSKSGCHSSTVAGCAAKQIADYGDTVGEFWMCTTSNAPDTGIPYQWEAK